MTRTIAITDMPELEWNALLPEPRHNWTHFNKIDSSADRGRKSLCFEVRVRGELRALVPAFIMEHRNFQDSWHWLRRLYNPQALVLGSPREETCPLGFAAGVTSREKQDLLSTLLRYANAYARKNECDILVVKHADHAADELWTRACVPLHLRRLTDISILGSALCGHRVANTSNWYRSRVSWSRWSEALFDAACTVDLNEEEMSSLVRRRKGDNQARC
ncbi:MAG: hypothetical protein ABI616_04790 [Pseudomonadota bacterium]